MIGALIEQFEHNLDEQLRIYQRIAELTAQQGEALAARNAMAVYENLQELEMAVLERGKIEVRRAALITNAARVLGVDPDEVSVELLTRMAGIQASARLRERSEQLQQVMAGLAGVVARNRASLEFELQVVDHMVKGITEERDHRPVYGRQGTHGELPRRAILDAQV